MKAETREMVRERLSNYGASLSEENFIVKGDKETGVRVKVKGKRLRFEIDEKLYASGPIKSDMVSHFVEKFWFWKQTNGGEQT